MFSVPADYWYVAHAALVEAEKVMLDPHQKSYVVMLARAIREKHRSPLVSADAIVLACSLRRYINGIDFAFSQNKIPGDTIDSYKQARADAESLLDQLINQCITSKIPVR